MPKTKISEYSTVNTDNSDIESINISEGCAPSGINNAIRELMVHLKEFQTGASGDAFTFAGGVLISGSLNTVTGAIVSSGSNSFSGTQTITGGINSSGSLNTFSGTVVMSGANTISHAAGTVSLPSITVNGDTNTGIFFPAADTIAFAEGGVESMRIDSSGNVGIGTTSPGNKITIQQAANNITNGILLSNAAATQNGGWYHGGSSLVGREGGIDTIHLAAGNVGIGTSSPASLGTGYRTLDIRGSTGGGVRFGNSTDDAYIYADNTSTGVGSITSKPLTFITNNAERARITSGGDFLVGKTATDVSVAGLQAESTGTLGVTRSGALVIIANRSTSDGTIISLRQDNTEEGNISVSGNTVSYNAFCGGHWSQLQEGRGYNPEILRGTVMSSIGEMAEWKSVTWTETIEHPAIPAVEAKEAVLDEEGNIVEPAVEAVEGKDAWTEFINKRDTYLGNLPIGATFEEDGFTKTVVDDGNERLPKVKISDVVGDKAVYGVFQTWDEAQDMLITSLGAFVVRIAAGVTVQIGDLLESNGDGCAKVQDDDVIRSKTIGKVTSTVATATYADGSYTVPCVLYCG